MRPCHLPIPPHPSGDRQRTVSLLPEFALPYPHFRISMISLFLVVRLLNGLTLQAAAAAAGEPHVPCQRGQFWIRRFRHQAETLASALLTGAPLAASFVSRAPPDARVSRLDPVVSLLVFSAAR